MNRTISIVLLAIAVGLVSGWCFRGERPHRQLQAQAVSQQLLGDEFSPEEKVNIRVYESVNRSVVHITTMSARLDSFLLYESPTEGAG